MPADLIASEILAGRKLLLWIGAGNSCSAGIPPDSDDENGLAFRLALVQYNNDRALIAARLGSRFRLADLAIAITKVRVRQLILQQSWIDLDLNDSQRAVAAIVAEGFHMEIVTVNYDPLIEKALQKEELHPAVICSAASYSALTEDKVFVVKIHGCPFNDNDSTHLLMLQSELVTPPAWVTTFLNGRLPERIFVYVGFSGNAEYVRDCVRTTSETLHGNVNDAYGVDRIPTDEVFGHNNPLRDFYQLSRVPERNYCSGGADEVFREVANIVFREKMLSQFAVALPEATRHGCIESEWLASTLREMTYAQIKSLVRKTSFLSKDVCARIESVALGRVFKWILILVCRGIIDRASLRPVLAYPYYPGERGIASAPIVFLDGFAQEVSVCRDEIRKSKRRDEFSSACQVSAEPKWYVVIVNCTGNIRDDDIEIIQRDSQSTARRYDPILFVDENSMVSAIDDIERLFR